ncbi:MAG: hypothetical protein FJ149_05525 [Euryarchaeota archaeon]|nr:hypothetical protein [Euryarchaeota archaeon]
MKLSEDRTRALNADILSGKKTTQDIRREYGVTAENIRQRRRRLLSGKQAPKAQRRANVTPPMSRPPAIIGESRPESHGSSRPPVTVELMEEIDVDAEIRRCLDDLRVIRSRAGGGPESGPVIMAAVEEIRRLMETVLRHKVIEANLGGIGGRSIEKLRPDDCGKLPICISCPARKIVIEDVEAGEFGLGSELLEDSEAPSPSSSQDAAGRPPAAPEVAPALPAAEQAPAPSRPPAEAQEAPPAAPPAPEAPAAPEHAPMLPEPEPGLIGSKLKAPVEIGEGDPLLSLPAPEEQLRNRDWKEAWKL